MRRFQCALLSAVAVIGFASVASAADLPVKAPMVQTLPPYNWGGWYLGGNIGYGWGVSSDPGLSFVDAGGGVATFVAAGAVVTPNISPKGVIGGLQLGYNWMVSPNWLVGLVADLQASGVKASGSIFNATPGVLPTTQSNSLQTDWFGTVRAKLGWAQNNWLVYGTGGLAYGQVKSSGVIQAPAFAYIGSNSTTKAGWAVGAGIDYGVTSNWTVGLEYLYVDLGRVSYTETQVPLTFTSSFTISNHDAMNIVRLTANYKF